ncbi:hypothetical protein Cgig2_011604 [Carnegiea gigantea]|uniref:Uncharacterized protein n=1 Tax=Carnegiea gigantea TaxID=171969 RepID=A0A9Q1GL83_9CARY|nr:hypothetical protein Cgig2_011604 [Carnegiea gigantea]
MTVTPIMTKKQDPHVTTTIPTRITLDDVVEAKPLQSVPTTIGNLFVNLLKDWVQESILNGIKVEETFSATKIITKIEELVDIPRLRLLSSQDSAYNSEIAHMEDKLKELSIKALELELKEKEILREEERLRKMREDLMDHKQKLVTTERELRTSPNLKRKEKE